jgi:hypothetical protein
VPSGCRIGIYGVIKWVAVDLAGVLDRGVSEAIEAVVALVSPSDASEDSVCVLMVQERGIEALGNIVASLCVEGLAICD